MSQTMLLHFTLGPVQGFIGSARRTRDYWAGSFLLGYLSGIAVRAVAEGWPFPAEGDAPNAYGEIDFPDVGRDKFYKAVCRCAPDSTVYIATLPNRFRARIGRPDDFARNRPCEKAVQAAWNRIADAVWQQFLEPIPEADRPHARGIWDRQISNFFEMAWVMGPDPGDGSDGIWLDRRKNWRSQIRGVEGGDHCRIMGDYQELSGRVRSKDRDKQDRFWDRVRERVLETLYGDAQKKDEYDLLELRNTERLCAIALVKRLFPLLPALALKRVLGWVPDGPASALRFWPSTAYMAAVPWLKDAWIRGEDACKAFTKAAQLQLPVAAVAERESRVRSLATADVRYFGMLDGGLCFEDALDTEIKATDRAIKNLSDKRSISAASTDPSEIARLGREIRRATTSRDRTAHVLSALRELIDKLKPRRGEEKTHRERHFERAPEFYALLLMDGDRGGALMHPDKLGAAAVSRGFGAFQEHVPGTVEQHDGVLIYGGADDVQALLPLDKAVDCAIALHDAYLKAFAKALGDKSEDLKKHPATISASLVFAHYHVPLASVIHEAHRLLDDVAKDKNGRNSVAIGVWKPSGKGAEYVTAFARERHAETGEGPIDHLMALARKYAREPIRSSSFIYNLDTRFGSVLAPQDAALSLDSGELERLLRTQWTKGREQEASGRPEAAISEILKVCRASRGDCKEVVVFRLEGARIAKFLADSGVGAGETG